MSEDIYRIISFPAFVNLITTREERYVHPLLWDDTHEGLYYTILNRPEQSENLLRKLCQHYNDDFNATLTNFLKVIIFPKFTYAQCWSTLSESDALWRIYSYDKMSVQIHTTVEDLRQLLEIYCSTTQYRVFIDDVKYDLKGTVDEMFDNLHNIIINNGEISDPFFHKRLAFEHEKEKRVIIYKNESASTYIQLLRKFYIYDHVEKVCPNLENATIDHLISAFKSLISDKLYKYNINHSEFVTISDLPKYIKSVKLNPFSPDWIDNLVEKLCSQNGLNYVGRSKLYEKV